MGGGGKSANRNSQCMYRYPVYERGLPMITDYVMMVMIVMVVMMRVGLTGMECEIDKKAVTGVTGSQKVGQREAIYKETRRAIYDSFTCIIGSGKFIGSERQKSSAKRTQRRWKGRPCMVIATSEGTFFASNKEKSAEQKVCIYFLIIILPCAAYRTFPALAPETRGITSINSWAWPRVLYSYPASVS